DGEPVDERIALVRFFDAEHALVAGSPGLETKNELRRTCDGGRTWPRVPLGVPHGLTVRVSDAQVSPDGRAWLAASTGILVAAAYGATWRYTADEPFEGAAECRSTAFATDELGLVGADGNALACTRDGGRTWTWLATPLDELESAASNGAG